jgi:hypothetical protein
VHQQRIPVPHNNTTIGLARSMTFGIFEEKKKRKEKGTPQALSVLSQGENNNSLIN